jgi:hypothetical protein
MTQTYEDVGADEGGAAAQTAEAAKTAAGEVAETAKEQLRQVTEEVGTQARNVAADLRGRVSEQARVQNHNLAGGIRKIADELDGMAAGRPDSPARAVVVRVAESGHQVADYLTQHGPDGVLAEVQEFARRRPGAFLATALVSGFVVGRLGRGILSAPSGGSRAGDYGRAETITAPAPMPGTYRNAPGTEALTGATVTEPMPEDRR